MRKIILLPQAIEDLDTIYEPVFSTIKHKMEMLRDFPELGQAMEEEFIGYRSLLIEPFHMIYRIVSNERIHIAAFFHVKRKLSVPPLE